jgi:hypothetical protein
VRIPRDSPDDRFDLSQPHFFSRKKITRPSFFDARNHKAGWSIKETMVTLNRNLPVPKPSASMLPGFKVHDLKKNVDERGFFAEIYREDWKELLGDDKVVQANLSYSYPGMIRAWHRHDRGRWITSSFSRER